MPHIPPSYQRCLSHKNDGIPCFIEYYYFQFAASLLTDHWIHCHYRRRSGMWIDSRRTGYCKSLVIVGEGDAKQTEGGRGLLRKQFANSEAIAPNCSQQRERYWHYKQVKVFKLFSEVWSYGRDKVFFFGLLDKCLQNVKRKSFRRYKRIYIFYT